MLISVSQRLEDMQIQASCQKSNSLPTIIADLHPPVVQSTPKVKQMHNNSSESPLQACVRETTSRGEEMQWFLFFPIIGQRDVQGNLLRIHTPITFKLLKELKTACAQCSSMAPFTQLLLENIAVEALPQAD